MTPSRYVIPPVLFAFLLATGCSSPKKTAEERDANGKKIEYVYITPTGSHVPVKVRKDQLQGGDSATTTDQEALRRLTQQSSRPDKQTGGN